MAMWKNTYRDCYRINVKTCKIGLKRAFYRLISHPKISKIIFLKPPLCIALKVILQVFTRILYLPQSQIQKLKHHQKICNFRSLSRSRNDIP